MEQKNNIIQSKSRDFAIRIVKLSKYLQKTYRDYVLSQQILRCGTSIGANVAESAYAISRKDFLSKIYIALKECGETLYWLDILYQTSYINEKMYRSLERDCMELKRILQSISKTTKESL